MSNTSRRVIISCAIIGTVILLCIGLIGIAGISIFTLYPPAASQQDIVPSPLSSMTPENEIPPHEPDPPLQDESPEAPVLGETPTQPTPEITLPIEIIEQMDEIQAQVSELRGLQALQPVDRYLLTPDQLRTRVIEDFLDDYTAEDARDEAIVWAAFGLLEAEFDLYEFYMELFSEQVVGYYDSETKEMYIIQGRGFTGPERLTYAHEYVHALQDQHYQIEENLGYNDEDCEQNIDYCASISSLLEGDASLLELQWLYNHASEQDIRDIQNFYQDFESPYFNSAPSFLQEDFIFPYRAGQEFVEEIYEQSGWQGVDQVYANPPQSTEQILHPDRYPDVLPVTVVLPELQDILGEGWRELERGLWGEWYTYLFLAEGLNESARLGPEVAQVAADGWAGDAYLVYANDDSRQYVLVLKTVWKNETEASEFAEAFQRYASARFGGPASSGPSSWRWESSQTSSVLELEQDMTTWVIAPQGDFLNEIEERLSNPRAEE
jgi:hypothetical protein